MQLTIEQRVFVVINYHETKSSRQVKERFSQRFPGRNAPTDRTVLKNVRTYSDNGTSLNLNKGNSGHPTTAKKISFTKKSVFCFLSVFFIAFFNDWAISMFSKLQSCSFKVTFLIHEKVVELDFFSKKIET